MIRPPKAQEAIGPALSLHSSKFTSKKKKSQLIEHLAYMLGTALKKILELIIVNISIPISKMR